MYCTKYWQSFWGEGGNLLTPFTQVGDVRLEVILEQGDMSTPLYYNWKSAKEFVLIHIKSFSTEAPDPKLFTVPPACMLG